MGMESFGGDEDVAVEGAERVEDKDKAEAMAYAGRNYRADAASARAQSESYGGDGFMDDSARASDAVAEEKEEAAGEKFDAEAK